MATSAASTRKDDKQQSTMGHYCDISTCMGVVDWYQETRSVGKAFWAILVIAGLSITLAQTYGCFKDFFDDQHFQTSSSTELVDTGITYPNVTVCNFNRAKRSFIERDSIDPKVLIYLFQLFPVNYDIPLLAGLPGGGDLSSYLLPYQQEFDKYVKNPSILNMAEFFRIYGHDVSDTFIRKMHHGWSSEINDIQEIITVYGRCWKLNANYNQMFPGAAFGINLLLNSMLEEYLENVIYNNYAQQGFALSLNEGDEPFMTKPILLAPGTATNINLKAIKNSIKNELVPRYKSPCNEKPYLTMLNESYTYSNCIYDCYMQAIHSVCGCVLFGNLLKDYPLCNLTTAITCATLNPQSANTTVWDNLYQRLEECIPSCTMPCYEYTTYEATVSVSKFGFHSNNANEVELPEAILPPAYKSYNKSKELLKNMVSVKIFFTSNEVTRLETGEREPILQFISDAGGQLGLWMGLSIFSIIQFFYYVILACINGECICGRWKNRVISDNNVIKMKLMK